MATGQLWAGALLETAFEWSSCSQSLASWTPTLQGWILLRRGGLLPAAHGPGAARQLSPCRPSHTDLREGRRHEMCGQCASRAPVRLRGQLPQRLGPPHLSPARGHPGRLQTPPRALRPGEKCQPETPTGLRLRLRRSVRDISVRLLRRALRGSPLKRGAVPAAIGTVPPGHTLSLPEVRKPSMSRARFSPMACSLAQRTCPCCECRRRPQAPLGPELGERLSQPCGVRRRTK